jgi:hypothetical protein
MIALNQTIEDVYDFPKKTQGLVGRTVDSAKFAFALTRWKSCENTCCPEPPYPSRAATLTTSTVRFEEIGPDGGISGSGPTLRGPYLLFVSFHWRSGTITLDSTLSFNSACWSLMWSEP